MAIPVPPSLGSISFTTISASGLIPRIGTITNQKSQNNIETPNFYIPTSRGLIRHLSRDHYSRFSWVNIPFESFLEHTPSVPVLYSQQTPSQSPFHDFLGFSPSKHILSLSLRDFSDGRVMPPNGNDHVAAYCLRGVRKVQPSQFTSIASSLSPDILFALSDTPFTPNQTTTDDPMDNDDPNNYSFSQKRLTKSVERSAAWLTALVKAFSSNEAPSIIVHMAGLDSLPARRAFAHSLVEPIETPSLVIPLHSSSTTPTQISLPYQSLHQAVVGYSFDLVPLRLSIQSSSKSKSKSHSKSKLGGEMETIISCINESLSGVSPPSPTQTQTPVRTTTDKIRIVNSPRSPWEILKLVERTGSDVFDASWAIEAADVGVALGFKFPVADEGEVMVAWNLYDQSYAMDFSMLGGGGSDGGVRCDCEACEPGVGGGQIQTIVHSPAVDEHEPPTTTTPNKAVAEPRNRYYSRAYIHHLLHTHEMSAHTLLVLHNLAVLDKFFKGIRDVLARCTATGGDGQREFGEEVRKWESVYGVGGDGRGRWEEVLEQGREMWKKVERERGKGRLAREKKEADNEQ